MRTPNVAERPKERVTFDVVSEGQLLGVTVPAGDQVVFGHG